MSHILVAYTTNSGTTVEVANVIAEELGKDGTLVDIRRLEEVSDLAPYTAAVIGAPMILGWHRGAVAFVKKHQAALSRIPVAYFIMAMSLTESKQASSGTTPIYCDPGLVKPPKNANSLTLKERYSSVSNYASQPLKAAPLVKPVSIGIFGGKLEMYRLKFLQAMFVLLILRIQMGSLQNWPAIRQWAAQVSALLAVGQPQTH
ncbi:MAG TPA: flavodoxin domain-containing protein [Anaerolineae bacterium]|jgi:menaquinone-dependent protoporphyrinogen IX oxidase